MLAEIVPTRQIPNEPRRIWFTDDDMERLMRHFRQKSERLPAPLREFILTKLRGLKLHGLGFGKL